MPGFKSLPPNIAALQAKRDVEGLIEALRYKQWMVRMLAAEALGEMGDAHAVGPLVAALKDSHGTVRWTAVEALGKLGDAQAMKPLLAALKGGDQDMQWTAAEALGKLGNRQALEPLVAAMHDRDLDVRARAAAGRAVAMLGDPRPGVLAPNGVPEFVWCEVPAGTFRMGGTGERGATFPLDYPFWTAKYPVTYAQYEAFVIADGYRERRYWTNAGWDFTRGRTEPFIWDSPIYRIANHPVVWVHWFDAYAFTQWLNEQKIIKPAGAPKNYVIRLPRECEWEKAARYPDGRWFPWGKKWDRGSRVNWHGNRIGRTSAVGLFPTGANPAHGACDLLGNVSEWCLTQWVVDYTSPQEENNDPEGYHGRAERGSGWRDPDHRLYSITRNRDLPTAAGDSSGFRVVLSVPI